MENLDDWTDEKINEACQYTESDLTEAGREADAVKFKCDCEWGSLSRIMVDLDDDIAKARWNKLWPLVQKVHPFSLLEEWTSKSGRGQHKVVTLNEPLTSMEEVLMLASILGDDPMHTLYAWKGWKQHKTPPVLFRPKQGREDAD